MYSTALQIMYIIISTPMSLAGFFGSSVSKSHGTLYGSPLSSRLPGLQLLKDKNKKNSLFYKTILLYSPQPQAGLWPHPKPSACLAIICLRLTHSSPHQDWLQEGHSVNIPGPSDVNYTSFLNRQKKLKSGVALNNIFLPPF